MVGSLKYKGADPNHKGRGAGWYWHRGNGEHSKYTGRVDSKVKAKVLRIRDPKARSKAQILNPHTHDYKATKGNRTIKKSYKGNRIPKTPKGNY